VTAAEKAIAEGGGQGDSAVEQISKVYGRQAVVVSIDPRRVYITDPSQCPEPHKPIELPKPAGEEEEGLLVEGDDDLLTTLLPVKTSPVLSVAYVCVFRS